MSWTETHRRWQILRDIETAAAAGATELPWDDEWGVLFGDRAGLLAMVRYRWQLTYDAQLDSHLPEQVLEEHRRRLDVRLHGVRRLLERYGALGGDTRAAA